jgi:hypothetical protein
MSSGAHLGEGSLNLDFRRPELGIIVLILLTRGERSCYSETAFWFIADIVDLDVDIPLVTSPKARGAMHGSS